MGQKLINLPRPKVFTLYKPKTPIIILRDEEKPFLSSFIGEKSWSLFYLLKLNRPQEWLNVPSEDWNKFEKMEKHRNSFKGAYFSRKSIEINFQQTNK